MIGLFLVALLAGCSHDESPEAVDLKQTSASAEFVSADEATTIAAAVQFGSAEATTAGGKATTRSAGLNKEMESVTPVPDASGATAFYVINYKGGGFMLLAADKRVNPVLAFSETGTFSIDGYRRPLPSPPPSQGVDPDEGEDCKSESKTYGSLLKTIWHQGPGYNDLAPYGSCSQLSNGRAYAGCVAIAMAQVMKYHRFLGAYNLECNARSLCNKGDGSADERPRR